MSYFFAEAQLVTSTRPHRALRKRIKSEADRIKTPRNRLSPRFINKATTVQATGFMVQSTTYVLSNFATALSICSRNILLFTMFFHQLKNDCCFQVYHGRGKPDA
jgi:hypothetical protein